MSLKAEEIKGKCAALIPAYNQEGNQEELQRLFEPSGFRTCDGTLVKKTVYEPFGMHTEIGSKAIVLFSYLVCTACKRMYQE